MALLSPGTFKLKEPVAIHETGSDSVIFRLTRYATCPCFRLHWQYFSQLLLLSLLLLFDRAINKMSYGPVMLIIWH